MKCTKIQSHLSAFIDNELDERNQTAVEQHLDTCSNCTAKLVELQRIDAFFDDSAHVQADPYLLTRIKAELEAEPRAPRRLHAAARKSLAPATVLAGLCLGIVLGIQLNTLAASRSTAEPTSRYSVIDPNVFEPMPSGSITALYTSVNSIE